MKNFLLYLHQLPQNIAGFILSRSWINKCDFVTYSGNVVTVYFTNNVFGAGVSLGKYIVLDDINYHGKEITTTVSHEYGHQIQSLYLGWLYIPVVGIASFVRNVWDRLFHKKWSNTDRYKWYYSSYPELQADRLGKVPSRWW